MSVRMPGSFLSACLLALILSACSTAKDGSIGVRLEYPQEGNVSAPSGGPAAGTPRPLYSKLPGNRILIRVLAPHIATPMEAWFDRSAGRGEIAGIPPGTRIAVEVDEYDNTATTLLGRGWYQGITLSAGQYREVPVAMYDRWTIVRICGAAPDNVSGAGTSGDTGDGGLAADALLETPLAVKVGPGDEVFVSSSQYYRIRKIDRYGYISHYAGDGTIGTLSDGQAAVAAPIGPVYDLDIGPSGDLFFITWDQQIVKIDKTTGLISVKYNAQKGNFYPSAKPDLAVANDNEIYYTNGMDPKVYLVQSGARSDYVWDNGASQLEEGALKNTYRINYPASVTYNPAIPNLYFADSNNNRIKSMTMGPMGQIYTKVGGGSSSFSDGIDPLLVALTLPYYCEYELTNRNFFYRERYIHRIRVVRPGNMLYTLAGTASAGYSGDGSAATSAALNEPSAVAVDSRGNVYIADSGNHALRMVIGGALP